MTALHKNFAEVHGLRLAYAEAGGGDPIVFLHGNPASSFVRTRPPGQVFDAGERATGR